MDVLAELKKAKIVAIMRGIPVEDVVKTVKAMKDGGVYCCEVTFDQKTKDFENTAKSISLIKEAFGDDVLVGAGTVLTVEQAEMTAKAGGRFVISPDSNPDVIKRTKELGMVSIPGALTPTEIVNAYRYGADLVKIFPAGDFGTGYIKSVSAPISHIPLVAVGGVNVKNAKEFLDAGCVGLGIGSALANKKLVAAGDFAKITETAREYVEACK